MSARKRNEIRFLQHFTGNPNQSSHTNWPLQSFSCTISKRTIYCFEVFCVSYWSLHLPHTMKAKTNAFSYNCRRKLIGSIGCSFPLRTWLLLLLSHLIFDKTCYVVVESFLNKNDRCSHNKRDVLSQPFATIFHSTIPTTTATRRTSLFQERRQARRWNGNYKHASKKLSDVPKSKKLMLNLTANGVTKTLLKKRMETLQHVLTKAKLLEVEDKAARVRGGGGGGGHR